MKKYLLGMLLVLSFHQTMAIDPAATISEDDQLILNQITEELRLPELTIAQKKDLVDSFTDALSGDWNSYWLGNGDLADSRFADDSIRVYDLIVTNPERIFSITYTYFPAAQQIYMIHKQFVYTNSDDVLELYEGAKKDEEQNILAEADNYAFFETDGYVDYTIYHIDGKEAMINYIHANIIDLSPPTE